MEATVGSLILKSRGATPPGRRTKPRRNRSSAPSSRWCLLQADRGTGGCCRPHVTEGTRGHRRHSAQPRPRMSRQNAGRRLGRAGRQGGSTISVSGPCRPASPRSPALTFAMQLYPRCATFTTGRRGRAPLRLGRAGAGYRVVAGREAGGRPTCTNASPSSARRTLDVRFWGT
jgi:hypothetical protein